uniref:Secreted protein n=1 Tax=Steinernema glaseri TaxID=37863 RepID=A0A1I8ATL1_9BILA
MHRPLFSQGIGHSTPAISTFQKCKWPRVRNPSDDTLTFGACTFAHSRILWYSKRAKKKKVIPFATTPSNDQTSPPRHAHRLANISTADGFFTRHRSSVPASPDSSHVIFGRSPRQFLI